MILKTNPIICIIHIFCLNCLYFILHIIIIIYLHIVVTKWFLLESRPYNVHNPSSMHWSSPVHPCMFPTTIVPSFPSTFSHSTLLNVSCRHFTLPLFYLPFFPQFLYIVVCTIDNGVCIMHISLYPLLAF